MAAAELHFSVQGCPQSGFDLAEIFCLGGYMVFETLCNPVLSPPEDENMYYERIATSISSHVFPWSDGTAPIP